MTEQSGSGSSSGPEDRIDRVLADALGKPRLDAAAMARVRDPVEQEWRAANPPRTHTAMAARRAYWAAMAAVASLAAVTAGYVVVRLLSAPVVVGIASRLDQGGAEVTWALVRHRVLSSGDPLRVGDTLRARGPALVSLMRGGSVRVAAGSVIKVDEETSLSLQQGRIYVDVPPGLAAANALRVLTAAGAVEHVGTQFEVLSDNRTVRIRVREGRVRLIGVNDAIEADGGTELLVQPGGRVARRSVTTYGADWLWIAALAPDYDIEGRPLADFLVWVSRELGRRLDFADARARDVANTTVLHGSIRGRPPIEALANVIATTSLTYEIREDTIRVHSAP